MKLNGNAHITLTLLELLEIEDSPYYNDEIPLVPVLVRIEDQSISSAYKGNQYLLQIWDQNTKNKVFEKSLKGSFINFPKSIR